MSDINLGFEPVGVVARYYYRNNHRIPITNKFISWNGWTITKLKPHYPIAPGRFNPKPLLFHWEVRTPGDAFVGIEPTLFWAVKLACDSGMFAAK